MNDLINLTAFGALLRWLPLMYWILCASLIGGALYFFKTRRWKVISSLLAVLIFSIPYLMTWKKQHDALEARKVSINLFKKRCTEAGEKIIKKVPKVKGVAWLKWREDIVGMESNQYLMNDPYGRDCYKEGCISALLKRKNIDPEISRIGRGFEFVESVDPADGRMYRYYLEEKIKGQRNLEQRELYRKSAGYDPGEYVYGIGLSKIEIESYSAKYGITWDDISTDEDRNHWIAGGRLRIIDLASGEVIAERVGFMIDLGKGNTSGGRQPWNYAEKNACPALIDRGTGRSKLYGKSHDFIYRSLGIGWNE